MKPILVLLLLAATGVRAAAQIPMEMPHPLPPQHESDRAPASESSESIDIGGVTLRLGMAQDDVLSLLRESYELREHPDQSGYEILRKGRPGWDLGSVQFLRGRLGFVNKEWTDENDPDTGATFANTLSGAVATFERESGGSCQVTTRSSQQPGSELKDVDITCGGRQRYLSIFVVSLNGRTTANINETLRLPEEEWAAGKAVPSPSAPGRVVSGREAVNGQEKGRRESAQAEAAVNTNAQRELADPSSLVTIQIGERLSDEELARIAAHNRALCDQTITVAGLTPNGLALYVPPEGQKFMAKNSQNYPRMCLLEDATNVVPGVPRYLLVYAYSENAFSGFQPVTRVTTATTPVSGFGTVSDLYGNAWNFTYSGSVSTTVMDTIEAPYVIQSHSLYLDAYDQNGNVVSRHSVTVSRQIGGNGASALGYNGVQLIALLWNNPSHLIKSVLKDVQKDSKRFSGK